MCRPLPAGPSSLNNVIEGDEIQHSSFYRTGCLEERGPCLSGGLLTPGKIRLACCDPEAHATTRIRFERHTIDRTQRTQERDAMKIGIKAMGRDFYKRLSK